MTCLIGGCRTPAGDIVRGRSSSPATAVLPVDTSRSRVAVGDAENVRRADATAINGGRIAPS